MTDLDVTILLIKSAQVANDQCYLCALGVLEKMISLSPDLPWKLAARGLAEQDEIYQFAVDLFEQPLQSDG